MPGLSADGQLYRLRLRGPDGAAVDVSSQDAPAPSVQESRDALTLRFATSDRHPARVECRFERAAPGVRCSVTVIPRSGWSLEDAEFPRVQIALPLSGTGEDDQLVLPQLDGALVKNPAASMKPGQGFELGYPGGLSAQFIAAVSPSAGVYIACYDSAGHTKYVACRRTDSSLLLSARHPQPAGSGSKWQLPYPVVLQPCAGKWTAAADIYKAWAVHQPWCARPLAARTDIPDWLRRGPFFHAVCVRNQPDGKQWVNFLPALPEYIASYHRHLGWPVCAMIMAWEKHGPWITPDYFPPFGGEDAFRRATAAILANGDATLVFLSGLKWTLERSSPAYDGWSSFEARGRDHAIVGPDGNVQTWGQPDADVGKHAQICPATPLAREILVGSTLTCLDLGILCVQVDQIVGGAMPPCYSPHHGHPQGYGRWLTQAVYDVFAETVKAAKAKNPLYAFAIEEPNEFFIPLLHCYHARDYQFGRWPRYGPGPPYPMPLFSYLYHEYVLGYGGDSASLSQRPSAYLSLAQALNAVTGKTPGGCVWTRATWPEAVHPSILEITRQHCALLAAGAGKWLLEGRMLDFDFANASTVLVRAGSGQDFQFRAVLSSSWAARDGSVAWLLANFTESPQDCSVVLDDRGALGGRPAAVEKRLPGRPAEQVAQNVRLPIELKHSLP
ncbi:MAG: hypothetical protein H5T86_10095, partial [Armatimonadetes bacterium]|nr:hypothetical protein [Armatimonadota bacterium]